MDITLTNLASNDLSLNTLLIQSSIDEISLSGGGTLTIPKGKYHIKTIFLKDNVCLNLEEGCELIGSTNIKDYGYSSLELKYSCGVGNVVPSHYYGLIIIEGAHNASICGKGIINGMGKYQKYFPNKDDPSNSRPFLVILFKSKDFYIESVTLKDSGMYAFYSMASDNVHVNGIKIRTLDSINGDGVDFDGGKNIIVENCDIESSDDAVSTKTYTNYPIQNVLVRNCKMKSNWAGVRIGTESASDMENITVENCEFYECRDGIKIQLCGPANYRNITFKNIKMRDICRPFFITLSKFRLSVDEGEIMPNNGVMENLKFINIDINETGKVREFQNNFNGGIYEQKALFISGYYNNHISHVLLDNVHINLKRNHTGNIRYDIPEFVDVFEQYPEIPHAEGELPCSAFYLRNIDGFRMNNVSISIDGKDNRPVMFFNKVTGEIAYSSFGNKQLCQTQSSIKSNVNIHEIDDGVFKQIEINKDQYLDYVRSYIPLITELEISKKAELVNIDGFVAHDEGEFIVFMPQIRGEVDIKIGDQIVASHRYAGNYRLAYAFAFKVNMKKGDKFNVCFLNRNDKPGHHGIAAPQYGVSYEHFVQILNIKPSYFRC